MTISSEMIQQIFSVSNALLEKYNTTGPRYTSYPTAPAWTEVYDYQQHWQTVQETNRDNPLPLSLYVHLPFCEHRCLFCGCNVVITQQREQAEKYLGYLFREIEKTASRMDASRQVVQFHWGGGTPTYLAPDQIERLFQFQKEYFNLAPEAEVAIEVDPRVTTSEQLATLKELGFNRISLGLQDFDPKVQETIKRIQPVAMTEAMVRELRDLGFNSINFDLIYGLPYQTEATFAQTLAEVIRLSPERIALYNYAHVPWLSPHQKQLPEEALPSGETKFQIFRQALQTFTEAGYVYIGMDHFAKPTDELAVALENGKLNRNFMGYTVQGSREGMDLYGFGVSAISGLERHYAQNWRKLSQYYEAIEQDRLPTMRGYALTPDDLLRRQVIMDILCRTSVNYAEIEATYGIEFQTYFAEAMRQVEDAAADGLLEMHATGFALTPLGRIFSRNIAMAFDAYLKKQVQQDKPTFSKTL